MQFARTPLGSLDAALKFSFLQASGTGSVDTFFMAYLKQAKLESFPPTPTKSTVEALANLLQPALRAILAVFRSKVLSELL